MKNLREIGVLFRGYNSAIVGANGDTGIALITVLNLTTGKYIDALGKSYNSTSDAGYIARTFDTYCSANYTAVERDGLMYWISLEVDNEYDISISGSGTKNIASSGYDIVVINIYEKEPWVDAYVNTTLRFWHSDFPFTTYDYTPVAGEVFDFIKTETLTADGLTNTFSLSIGRAYEFLGVSIDNGISYLKSYDTSLTWGKNTPSYDDETMNSDYRFTINFIETPEVGNIIIKYKPYVNRYKVLKTYKLPQDQLDSSIISTTSNLRELDYSVEVI